MRLTDKVTGRVAKVLLVCLLTIPLLSFLGCAHREKAKEVSLRKVRKDKAVAIPPTTTPENVIKVGFDLRLSPKEDIKIYNSFLKYLGKKTGYKFELHFTEEYESNITALGKGKTQFAFMGALSYIQAHQRYNVQCLVRGLNPQNRDKYRAVIFTSPNSKITSVGQLKGKAFAFGSEDSTQGHVIPRKMLEDAGIFLKDLKAYNYTGSHENCARAVIKGEFEAGGMQDTLAQSLEQEGRIKIIEFSDYYLSSGICVNWQVDPKVVVSVKKALLEFDPQGKDKAGLYCWGKTEMPNGFIEAKDSDYDQLRDLARKYGLLK